MRRKVGLVSLLIAGVCVACFATQPAVTGIDPDAGYDGYTVTITGSCFSGVTLVTFDGEPSPSFTIIDDFTIQAVVPDCSYSGPVVVERGCEQSNDDVIFYSLFTEIFTDGGIPTQLQDVTALFFDHGSGDLFATSALNAGACAIPPDTGAIIQYLPDRSSRRLSQVTRPVGLGMDSDGRLYFSTSCPLNNQGPIFYVEPYHPVDCPWPSLCVRRELNRLGGPSNFKQVTVVHAKETVPDVAWATNIYSGAKQLFQVPRSPSSPILIFSPSTGFVLPTGLVWDPGDTNL